MLIIGLVALLIAYAMPPKIFWLTYFAGTVFASSWGPIAFMSVWSTRTTSSAAFWGIIAGFAGNAVPKLLSLMEVISLPVYLDPVLIGAVLSLVVIVLVTRLGQVSEKENEFRQQMHQTPQTEIDSMELSRTLLWPKALMLAGITTPIVLFTYYVRPYAETVENVPGTISGELALAIGYGAMFFVSGVLAYIGVKKSYDPVN